MMKRRCALWLLKEKGTIRISACEEGLTMRGYHMDEVFVT